ncbi:MAG: ATP synthase F0 subunit C [Proteobacteria bacterium]|nr:ATP synthase F0 subunit C [Pseudomonadota bacterium]
MKTLYRIGKTLAGLFGAYMVLVMPAMAAEGAATDGSDKSWLKMLAAGITIAAAAIGGAAAQGRASSSALEAIGRNPSAQNKIFVPMIVALALIESLVIYALVVVFAKM